MIRSLICAASLGLALPGWASPAPAHPTAGPAAVAVEVATQEVTYTAGDTTLKGYLAWPKGQTGRPGVLVVHEWWGHNAYARRRAEQLASLGYAALAVDMYGDGRSAGHPKDAMAFSKALMGDPAALKARFMAAHALLAGHPSTHPERIAAIGYCMGGKVVLRMAREGMPLAAVASFHGSLGTDTPVARGTIKGELLVAHGAADPLVPAADVQAFEAEMKAAGVKYEFVAYEGATHAFTNPDATALGAKFKLPLAYDEAADKDAWKRLEGLLARAFPSAR
ncbi:MAG: dienelactone hydrolase family protein [Myxococcales bacterium]|nr:dienelactone hydrolase family protein [Myxococcales bacterium]